ncbi:MAG: diaminopimelate epimerase [Elusimicrobiales bacterium]
MKIKFWKMSGAGNDFVLINRSGSSAALKKLAVKFCDRKAGIGADGLLYVNKTGAGKISLRYFNSDGSEAFCGNGSRCAVWWAGCRGLVKGGHVELSTNLGVLPARITGHEKIKIRMPAVPAVRLDFKGAGPGPTGFAPSLRGLLRKCGAVTVHFLNTGVPHAVVPLKDLKTLEVSSLGRSLRFHKAFGPSGANIDFVELKGSRMAVRTYERGVEAETLACGTGITAAAIALGLEKGLSCPVRVTAQSGERFKVWFKPGLRGSVDGIYLEGPAKLVFTGEINI